MLSYQQIVKYLHLLVAVPLLLYVGCKGLDNQSIPQYVYIIMMVMATGALIHHSGFIPLESVLNLIGIEAFTPAKHTIYMVNNEYRPQHVHVRKGDTVRWINRDSSMHTATAFNESFNSELLMQDEVYEHTFDVSGVHNYYCRPHPYMKGTISVVDF